MRGHSIPEALGAIVLLMLAGAFCGLVIAIAIGGAA